MTLLLTLIIPLLLPALVTDFVTEALVYILCRKEVQNFSSCPTLSNCFLYSENPFPKYLLDSK